MTFVVIVLKDRRGWLFFAFKLANEWFGSYLGGQNPHAGHIVLANLEVYYSR